MKFGAIILVWKLARSRMQERGGILYVILKDINTKHLIRITSSLAYLVTFLEPPSLVSQCRL